MKKFIGLLGLGFLFVGSSLFGAEVFGNEGSGKEGSGNGGSGKEDTVIRVGYFSNSTLVRNIASIDRKGFGYDLLVASEEYSDVVFEFVPVHRDNFQASLDAGVIDLFGGVPYQEEYESYFTYSQEFGFMQVLLLTDKESDILYEDFSGMEGQTVTVWEEFEYQDMMFSYLEEHGLQLDVVEVASEVEFYRSESALYLGSNFMSLDEKKVVAFLGSMPLHFVGLPENAEKILLVDQALSLLEARKPWIRFETYEKYFQESALAQPVLTVDDMSLLQEHGVFTVGYGENLFPLEGVNEFGEPEGIFIELMDFVADLAGIQIKYVPFALGEAVNYHLFDVCLAYAGNEVYLDYFSMTDEIVGSPPLVLIGGKGISEPKTQVPRIGILSYATFDFDVLYQKYPNSDLVVYYSYEKMVEDLDSGELDGLLVSNFTSWYMLEELGDSYDSYHTGLYLPLRLFVSEDLDPRMVEIFNRLLGQLDSDMVEKLMLDQVSNLYEPPTFWEEMVESWYYYSPIVLGVVSFVVMLYVLSEKKKQDKFLNLLCYDELTGFMGEEKFRVELELRLKEVKPMAYRLMVFDVDGFALMNLQYGKEYGDKVLSEIAKTLVTNYPKDSLFCRSGDDLFYIFSQSFSDLRAYCGKAFCDGCLSRCGSSMLRENCEVSISGGYYVIDDVSVAFDEMLAGANMARMLGKGISGISSFGYTSELEVEKLHREIVVSEMETALGEGAFGLQYQLVVDAVTGEIVGGESLVRWYHLESGRHPVGIRFHPEEFMSIFVEEGFITVLDFRMLEKLCQFISREKRNPYLPMLSLNLSAVTLLLGDFMERLQVTLSRYGIGTKEIGFEICESGFFAYPDVLEERVAKLKEMGFRVGMDNLGIGACTLGSFKNRELSYVKLDKNFMEEQLKDERGSLVLKNLIFAGKDLGMTVVAEGLETLAQVEQLRGLGCDLLQGNYYGEPMEGREFLATCRESVCLSAEKRAFLKETNRYESHGGLKEMFST